MQPGHSGYALDDLHAFEQSRRWSIVSSLHCVSCAHASVHSCAGVFSVQPRQRSRTNGSQRTEGQLRANAAPFVLLNCSHDFTEAK